MSPIDFRNYQQIMPVKQGGFTLIEVLIAFLVLAIGLVGMASLQLTSVKSAHTAYLRSVASSIALDMEENLWLQVANMDPAALPADGCPNTAATITQVQALWSGDDGDEVWTNNAIAAVPGIGNEDSLSVTVVDDGNASPSGNPFWRETTYQMQWNRASLSAEDQGTETFTFTSRVVCRPIPAP